MASPHMVEGQALLHGVHNMQWIAKYNQLVGTDTSLAKAILIL